MLKRSVFLIGISIIPILVQHSTAFAEDNMRSGKMVIISVPALSFQEINPKSLQNYPQLRRLSEQGQLGALNNRTPFKGIEDSYLTIGAGSFASSKGDFDGVQANEARGASDPELLYERYVGETIGSAQIFIPQIAAIQQMNRTTTYQARPGLLGDVLEEAKIAVTMYGNRDRGTEIGQEMKGFIPKRTAALMMMNGHGKIQQGIIDHNVLLTDETRSYAVKTNYDLITQRIKSVSAAAIIFVELGDLDRLFAERDMYTAERFQKSEAKIMSEIDTFIGLIVDELSDDDRLLVFSPQVHAVAEKAKLLLTPLFFFGQGIEQGIVTSNTTRRPGVVSSLDIAPTILDVFGLEKRSEMTGFSFEQQAKRENLTWLYGEVKDMADVYRLRPQLLYPFVIYEIIVLLAALLLALYYKVGSIRHIAIPLLSLLAAPLVFLRFNVFFTLSPPIVSILFFITILVIALLLYRLPLFSALAVLSALTVLVLIVDGWFGAELMKRSVLGYDPMIGARYYGMGNEYMGVLIGAAVLCVSVGMHYLGRHFVRLILILSTVLFVLIIAYLGSPRLGTNAGGAIAATVTFGIAWIRMFGGKLLREVRWPTLIMFVGGLGVVSVGILWLLNYSLLSDATQQSHIGRAMHMVSSGRLEAIGALIARKLSMNWHLIGVSLWGKVLLTSLFVILVTVLRPRGLFARWQTSIPFIMFGFSANAIGSIVVLLVNDSGIVAAATMIVYVAVPMLLIKLQDIKVSHSS